MQQAANAACYIEAANDEARAKAGAIFALCTRAKLNYQEFKDMENDEFGAHSDFVELPVNKAEEREKTVRLVEDLEKSSLEKFAQGPQDKGKQVVRGGAEGGSSA